MSPHANHILGLAHAHHPSLATFIRNLAGHPRCTYRDACELVAAAMTDLKLHDLDIEMAQPGATARIPFAVSVTDPNQENQQSINSHVLQMLPGGRK
jgi:hypothetical protein